MARGPGRNLHPSPPAAWIARTVAIPFRRASAKAPAVEPLAGAFVHSGAIDARCVGTDGNAERQVQGDELKVRSYGKLADLLGQERTVEIETPCTVAALREHLAAQCPAAAEALASKQVRACVGDAIVSDSHILSASEPVELLAPVSGG